MSSDPSPTVRHVAVRGLHELGRAQAAEPLTRLSLEISSRVTEQQIDHWLENPAPTIADLELQALALRAVADLDARIGLPALLAAAKPIATPRDSATALALAESVYRVRRVAIYGLGYTGSLEAAAFLTGENGIGDRDFRLRATAARSLGVLGLPDANQALEPLLSDPTAEVRWTAAMVLGRLSDPASGRALVTSLGDRHAEVRTQAALSLGYLGHTTAVSRLRRLAVEDESPRVREAASLSTTLLER
jgi:HEAT repeat protein